MGFPFIGYVYVGRCSDGRYWFIFHNLVRYVVYVPTLRGTVVRTFCRVRDAVRDRTLWRALPREVREVLMEKLRDYLEWRRKVRETRNRVTALVWAMKKVLSAVEENEEALRILEKTLKTMNYAGIEIEATTPTDLALLLEELLSQHRLINEKQLKKLENTYTLLHM